MMHAADYKDPSMNNIVIERRHSAALRAGRCRQFSLHFKRKLGREWRETRGEQYDMLTQAQPRTL